MILVVGASGKLGGEVARLLIAKGLRVRALSRSPERLGALRGRGAEIISGDVRNRDSLIAACTGADKVVAAAHAFTGTGTNGVTQVDDAGNRALIDAARMAGVEHFVFTSACTGPNDPVDFFRVKYAVEQYLRSSGVPFTILRPGAFMEDHAERIGRPVVDKGWTVVFGRGEGLANYVAVGDVAQITTMILREPPRNDIVWIGGPENLSAMDVVRTYEKVTGRNARVYHIPEPVLQMVGRLLGTGLPVLRRIIDAGRFMESGRQQIDPRETLARYPIRLTSLEEFVRQRYTSKA